MAPPKIFGLIGYPLKHSLSALMHNAALRALKINAEYRLFEVRPEDFNSFLSAINKKNILGLNVTVPYKEKILEFIRLGSNSFYLRQIKAANTIVKKNNVWLGYNTDIPGFSKHLKENFNPRGKRAAILGAGGAARAVAYVLAKSNAGEIAIFDIDSSKSKSVSAMIRKIFPDFAITSIGSIEELDIRNKDLLVNATPVGLRGSDPCLIQEALLHKNLFVYDLIYNPSETKLLALARKTGARASNGLGMLLYQGALAFRHFTGKAAPIEIMRKELKKGVEDL